MRSRTSAWIVTSRAVVGSSAMSRSGSLETAPAMSTRCAMPPETWCGYALNVRSGSGIPDAREEVERSPPRVLLRHAERAAQRLGEAGCRW